MNTETEQLVADLRVLLNEEYIESLLEDLENLAGYYHDDVSVAEEAATLIEQVALRVKRLIES